MNAEELARAQRRGNNGMSSRDVARMLALLGLVISGCFWYPVQWDFASPQRYGDMAIALGFGTFLVLGPPVLSSFFVPWTPAARFLYRINATAIGQMVAGAAALYLLYYAGMISYTWWASRPVVAGAGLAFQQMVVGLIATIVTPALLWAPVSSEELEEIARQDHLVKRYELQVQADLAYLQGIVLDAQQAAARDLAVSATNAAPDLAWTMKWLIEEMDRNIAGIAGTVSRASGTVAEFPQFANRDDVIGVLDYVAEAVRHASDRPPLRVVDVTPEAAPAADVQTAAESGAHVAARDVTPHATHDPGSSVTIPDQASYTTARRGLGSGAWMIKDMAQVLRIEESTARKIKAEWERDGLIIGAGLNGRFRFTEEVQA